jgi:hypothetical protein
MTEGASDCGTSPLLVGVGSGRCWPAREWRCGGGAAGGDLRQGMAVGLAVMAVVGRHIDADGRRRWPWRIIVAAG